MAAKKGSELFTAGDLTGAVVTLTDEVKRNPTDQQSRGLLAECLCLAGDLERADKQLDVLTNQDMEAAPALAMFRQVIRAELARREFYAEGRVPEFLDEPTPLLRKHLEASILLRDGELWCIAGRSLFLDGGLRLIRLDPATGLIAGTGMETGSDIAAGKQTCRKNRHDKKKG